MTIEGPFYQLVPASDSSSKYDLYLLRSIGGKNPRKEFKLEGYGFILESAIQRIINFATREKLGFDSTVTIKEYLDEYKRTRDEIREALGI